MSVEDFNALHENPQDNGVKLVFAKWINDAAAEALEQALDQEYRALMRDLIDTTMTRLSESRRDPRGGVALRWR